MVITMKYSLKLKDLREEKELTLKDVANELNISRSLYGRYEKGYAIIPINHLIVVCDFFGVSIDYVFGFTNKVKYSKFNTSIDKINVGLRIKNFRKENNITQQKLAEYLHTNRSLLSNYEKGIYLISTSFLYDICKKYKISADYLLGRVDSPKYLK